MKIQHNIAALNTHRSLNFNNTNANKALEKLSSGYKINRAGDDAAGLAISEKMRGQIRGLNMASKNAQDGISLIQTAEGAMNEVHALLQRGRELAVQAANDTNVAQDRQALQKEITQINDEIDRIGRDTEFNTMKILNSPNATSSSSFDRAAFVETLKAGWLEGAEAIVENALGYNMQSLSEQKVDVIFQGDGPGGAMATAGGLPAPGGLKLTLDPADFARSSEEYKETVIVHEMVHMQMASTGALNHIRGHWFIEGIAEFVPGHSSFKELEEMSTSELDSLFTTNLSGGNDLSGNYYSASYAATVYLANNLDSGKTMQDFVKSLETGNFEYALAQNASTKFSNEADFMGKFETNGKDLIKKMVAKDPSVSAAIKSASTFDPYNNVGRLNTSTKIEETTNAKYKYNFTTASAGGPSDIVLHIGANSDQNINVSLPGISADALGTTLAGVSEGGDKAIEIFDKAISIVSDHRSNLGAVQNRLEHTINNLGSTAENLTAAESRIRDTDMAKEMMNFTKQNILMQAAQSMLSQANQQPQGVLQLLG